jgi:large subunit ribosomal protein L17
MRHRRLSRNLSRNASHRKAMLRNMVTSLFKFEQLETTDEKAKELRRVAEKMITLSKRGDLHARRQALGFIKDKAVTHKLFEELKDRYLQRQGGYVRIAKKGTRKGDGALVSVIQILPGEQDKKAEKKKEKTATKSRTKETKAKREVESKGEKKEVVEPKSGEVSGSTEKVSTES